MSEAGVTRATFYRHFPGKQDLVLAYLQGAHDVIEERMAVALAMEDPRARLRALGEDIADQLLSPGFGGCAFIKVASEFDDPDEPVRRAVSAHRTWFAEIVRTAFADAGHVRPDDPTRHFIMLRDGAMVAGYLDGIRAGRRDLRARRRRPASVHRHRRVSALSVRTSAHGATRRTPPSRRRTRAKARCARPPGTGRRGS